MSEPREENAPQEISQRERKVYRRSIFWPLILIAIGAIFLLRNTGALSGDAWDIILKLWPVILIAIGLDSLYRREGVAGAVFWIGLGAVFLLTNFGLFAWNVWEIIFSLWPILLIAIGLDLVLGRRSTWGAIVAMLVMLAVLVGALWFLGGAAPAGLAISGEDISQALGGATEAAIVLKPSAGSVSIDALSEGNQSLVQGLVRERSGETIHQEYSVSDGKAFFRLRSDGVAVIFTPVGGGTWDWRLDFNPSIPLDMEVGLGAGALTVDLSDLQISQLNVDIGVGQATVILPEQGQFQADISGAVGEIVIEVPAKMQVRIQSDTGLALVEVPDTFQRDGDVYTTPGFEIAGDYIEMNVSQAVGKITVRVVR